MHKQLFVVALAASVVTAFAHDEPQKPKSPASHDHSSKGHAHSGGKETAFGRAADPTKASRTILVEMRDSNEFSPAEITVRQGEIVRFVAVNAGIEMHEMVLGTMQDLKDHAAMMKKHRDMHHDEPHIAHVAPGNSGVIAWEFTKPGEFYFGCLVDDHFEKGMVGKIRVTAAAGGEHQMEHSHGGHASAGHAQPDEMQAMYGPYAMA